eukprot:267209_1
MKTKSLLVLLITFPVVLYISNRLFRGYTGNESKSMNGMQVSTLFSKSAVDLCPAIASDTCPSTDSILLTHPDLSGRVEAAPMRELQVVEHKAGDLVVEGKYELVEKIRDLVGPGGSMVVRP